MTKREWDELQKHGCYDCKRSFYEGYGDGSCPARLNSVYSNNFIKKLNNKTFGCEYKIKRIFKEK